MRIRSIAVASTTALTVVALIACSSSNTDPLAPTQDAASDTSTSADASTAKDVAVETGPDGKKACDTLTAAITTTQPKLTLTPANRHPFAEAPTATGGTLVEGTYRLSEVKEYYEGSATTAGVVAATLQLKEGLWEMVSSTGNGVSPATENAGGGAYVIADGKITWMGPGCGVISAGPSNGKEPVGPFTATATTLKFITDNGFGTVVREHTYAKD